VKCGDQHGGTGIAALLAWGQEGLGPSRNRPSSRWLRVKFKCWRSIFYPSHGSQFMGRPLVGSASYLHCMSPVLSALRVHRVSSRLDSTLDDRIPPPLSLRGAKESNDAGDPEVIMVVGS
jgi:hypothetical protein